MTTRTTRAKMSLSPGGWRCDIEGLLFGLITLLIVAIVVMIICYVVARLLGQVMPGAAPYVWLIYAIGGLIVLIYALRLFAPLLHL